MEREGYNNTRQPHRKENLQEEEKRFKKKKKRNGLDADAKPNV